MLAAVSVSIFRSIIFKYHHHHQFDGRNVRTIFAEYPPTIVSRNVIIIAVGGESTQIVMFALH